MSHNILPSFLPSFPWKILCASKVLHMNLFEALHVHAGHFTTLVGCRVYVLFCWATFLLYPFPHVTATALTVANSKQRDYHHVFAPLTACLPLFHATLFSPLSNVSRVHFPSEYPIILTWNFFTCSHQMFPSSQNDSLIELRRKSLHKVDILDTRSDHLPNTGLHPKSFSVLASGKSTSSWVCFRGKQVRKMIQHQASPLFLEKD